MKGFSKSIRNRYKKCRNQKGRGEKKKKSAKIVKSSKKKYKRTNQLERRKF